MNTEEILYICTSCGIKENIPKEVVEYFDEMDQSNINEWSYVNILDTKSQTFLCCTSS